MSERKYWAQENRNKSKAFDDISYLDKDIVNMLKSTDVCLNCGMPLSNHKKRFFYRGYCSKYCYNEKPHRYAYAEYTYNKPINELIINWLNLNNSIQLTADLIGVTKPSLYKYLKKHNINSITIWKEGNVDVKKTYEKDPITC
jgi:hypothetical protein